MRALRAAWHGASFADFWGTWQDWAGVELFSETIDSFLKTYSEFIRYSFLTIHFTKDDSREFDLNQISVLED